MIKTSSMPPALLAIALIVFAPPSQAQLPGDPLRPSDVSGQIWHGVGLEFGRAQSDWSMQVIFERAGASISYPSLGCSGRWTPLSGDSLRERIYLGRRNCTDGGVVRLRRLDVGRLAFHWRDASGKRPAFAVLRPGPMRRSAYATLLIETRAASPKHLAPAWRPPAQNVASPEIKAIEAAHRRDRAACGAKRMRAMKKIRQIQSCMERVHTGWYRRYTPGRCWGGNGGASPCFRERGYYTNTPRIEDQLKPSCRSRYGDTRKAKSRLSALRAIWPTCIDNARRKRREALAKLR